MKAEPTFNHRTVSVPPEQVMTRLMRRADERKRVWFAYAFLLICAGGILLGLFLSGRN